MENITTSVESAAASVQSSIIKPRFRDEDILFSTMNMFEDDDIMKNFTSSVKYAVPGTNNRLLSQSSYFTGLWYTFLRQILALWFTLYQYYLRIASLTLEFYNLTSAYFWYLLSFLPLPEDLSTVGPASIHSSSTIDLAKSQKESKEIIATGTRVYQFYERSLLLPTRIGNFILENSLRKSTPRTRMQIRQATGRFYIPDHIAFIFEMSPLVVPQPPEVPTPFLDYEKRIVIPDKKDVAKVLAQRAEWSSLHHTHKAAETFRVTYEAAKCITWAACSEVPIVTVFESNGYSWKDLKKMASVINEEMQNLTKSGYKVSDSIKLINLSTLETVSVFEDLQDFEKVNTGNELHIIPESDLGAKYKFLANSNEEIKELDPTPESIVSSAVDSPTKGVEKVVDAVPTFRTKVTVFFMSSKETDAKTFQQLCIRQELAEYFEKESINDKNIITQIESMHYPTFSEYLEEYINPDLLIKFCTESQAPNSLAGYPLIASGPNGLVFSSQAKPANFPHYWESLKTLNKTLKQKYN